MQELIIPDQVAEVLNLLNAHFYKAHIVGRCVRELILGRAPLDFDIITNADIERIHTIFKNYNLRLEHKELGEIIVMVQGMAILVSPYRAGSLADNNPVFTENIEDDLAQRVFSFDAVAYHPREGFVDPYHGIAALSGSEVDGETQRLVNVVNVPIARNYVSPFKLKPTSILWALGYYATGEYVISPLTKQSLLENKEHVLDIEKTALRAALSYIMRGKRAFTVLEEYFDVIALLIPELMMMRDFDQHSEEHAFDLLRHTFKTVSYASPLLSVRYAALFHGIGKPDCQSIDSGNHAGYFGHAERACIYTRRILERLCFNEDDIKEICFIIRHHDDELGSDRRELKRTLGVMSPEHLKSLLLFKYADMKAKSPEFEGAAMIYKRQLDAVNEIISLKEPYALQHLAVNRYDLIQNGVCDTDEQADELLRQLLQTCIESSVLNSRVRLLDIARKFAAQKQK